MCKWCDIRGYQYDPKAALPKQWGLKQEMCKTSLENLIQTVRARTQSAAQDFVTDYAKMYSVLLDEALISDCLDRLDAAILTNGSGTSPETNWLRFSSILAFYEKKCWFPEDVLLPMGVLKPEEFYHYIRLGYVLKDYGAGVKHGEFTHRLQWHVLMRVITEDFAKPVGAAWDHSPLELYTSLGKQENWGLWGLILDVDGVGKGLFPDYRHPDNFHLLVLKRKGNIGSFVARRETKRRQEFVTNIMDYLGSMKSARLDGAVKQFQSDAATDPMQTHQAFRDFESWLFADMEKAKGTQFAIDAYKALRSMGEPEYVKRKTAQVETLGTKPKRRDKPYVACSTGNVYRLSGTTLLDESAADTRAGKSHLALAA